MKKLAACIAVSASIIMGAGCTSESGADSLQGKASSDPFQEGVHYRVMSEGVTDLNADVTKFFWFGCPHCNELRGPFRAWADQNPEVTTQDVHSTISKRWDQDHMIFQVIQNRGYGHRATDAVYDYIHEDKAAHGDLVSYLKRQGIPVEKSHFDLSEVEYRSYVENIAEVARMEKKIGAIGVPYLVVKGKYLVLNQAYESYDQMLEGTKWLIENK